ncbi:hypothetical protein [Actinomadura monticuli]|uniref:Sensor domain-containing protein n=1 Tax=Actinomadura monticuli TaxID=3097367 RepID=A0ABV4QBQ4_9ACTN
MDSPDVSAAIAEYTSLRGEIDGRAKYQQQILALQLTLTGAIFGFALTRAGLSGIMLLIPVSSYLLGGRYVAQRTAIHRISTYIDEVLNDKVGKGFGWVEWSRANPRPATTVDWLIPMLLTFPGASLLALGWVFPLVFYRADVSVAERVGLIAVWSVGCFGAAVTARMIVSIHRGGDRPPSR